MLHFARIGAFPLAAALAIPAAASDRPVSVDLEGAALEWGACPPIFPGDCAIAVLHGDPAKPNSDVLLKVGPGYHLGMHRHSSAERMVLVGGRMTVSYAGHPAVTLGAGDYAFGPGGLAHEARCESAEPCLLFIAFEGPVDAEAVESAK